MGVVAKQDFISWYDNYSPSSAGSVYAREYSAGEQPRWEMPTGARKSAEQVWDELRQVTIDGRSMGKGFRPWTIKPDIMAQADRSQGWWGWEFETGWVSAAARAKAIEFTWDNFDGVTFDGEGEGDYPTEITFIPATVSEFLDGTAQAVRFYEWVEQNKDLTNNTGNTYAGTHLNISAPGLDGSNVHRVRAFVNNMLYWTGETTGTRLALFGREHLYGMAYERGASTGHWLELKTFRTAYSLEGFQKYLKVAAAIQSVVDNFVKLSASEQDGLVSAQMGVSNLRAMVEEGAAPVLRPLSELKYDSRTARPSHSRRDY